MATEGEGTQSGAEGSQSGAGDDTSGTGNSGTETNSGAGTQSGTETATNTEAEVARREAEDLRARMKAADQRAAKFETELKQLRDKDLPEQEKLLRDHAEVVKERDSLLEGNRALALKVAFLSDNSVTWHNPERAMKLVDLSNVEIDADGKVTGLKDALAALAKSDAYLVKTEKEQEKETPPATAPGTNGANGTGKPSTKTLSSRFPALNTRAKR
jgi:hypothetical protein